MGEIVVSFLLEVVFAKLASEPFQKLIRSQGIHSEIQNLKRSLLLIQDHLNDASEKEITDKGVQRWLNGLQHLAYDIEDVLDNLNTKAMRHELEEELGSVTSKVRKLIPTCCSNFTLSDRLRHKLDSIATQLQDLEKDRLTLGLNIVRDLRPKSVSRTNETSLPDASRIVGREGDKTKLIHKLLGDEPCKENFSIVPIVGLGGVGKTTLARLLYNEPKVSDRFEFKAWVCVSYEFDIIKITKSIIHAVTRKNKRENNNEKDNENKELGDLNQLQLALIEQLKDKRFLIVLDDIWSEEYVEWENLVKPFHSGAPGSKIIITTRTEQLLKKLGFDHLEHLKCLSDDKDVVSLFAQHALGEDNFDSYPTLRPHGEGIVKKCGGLPLALKALGTLLRTKTEEEDWKDVLNSEIWGLENDGIIPALRLIYHDLPWMFEANVCILLLIP